MGLGFGVFILAVAVLFVFTRGTLEQSSALAEEAEVAAAPVGVASREARSRSGG